MTTICVIMAMTEEISAFEQHLEKNGYSPQGNMEYRRDNLSIHIFRCGVGAGRLKKLAGKHDVLRGSSAIIIAGISGAINGNYGISDTIIPRHACLLDGKFSLDMNEQLIKVSEKAFADIRITVKPCYQVVTANRLVDRDAKRQIDFADAVDMETYHITAWLKEHDLPEPLCVRVISDTRNQRLPDEKSIVSYMRDPRGFIFKNTFAHPLECLKLLKLMLNSKKAVHILGEYMIRMIDCFEECFKGQKYV
ncbi:MAG: hypothetical protein RBU23_12405 [Candidatus Auribacterota bacterium]|nr:hypothetical protein [Candidatus Auribacterota bacterium]